MKSKLMFLFLCFLVWPYNKHLINQARLVWENLDLGHWYRPHCVGLYWQPRPRFSHTDLLLVMMLTVHVHLFLSALNHVTVQHCIFCLKILDLSLVGIVINFELFLGTQSFNFGEGCNFLHTNKSLSLGFTNLYYVYPSRGTK